MSGRQQSLGGRVQISTVMTINGTSDHNKKTYVRFNRNASTGGGGSYILEDVQCACRTRHIQHSHS